jgi:hypothetical protein
MQSLKHEEILLELESIRARRERLMPICPNCNAQTFPMYQPLHPPASATMHTTPGGAGGLHHYQSANTANVSPIHQHYNQQQQHSQQHHTLLQTVQQQQQHQQQQIQQLQQQQQQHLHHQQTGSGGGNPLLSINIPGQPSVSPNSYLSPQVLSALPQLHGLQGHLSSPYTQVITVPGKQSVTVDCQTSPTAATSTMHLHSHLQSGSIGGGLHHEPMGGGGGYAIQPTKYKTGPQSLLYSSGLQHTPHR